MRRSALSVHRILVFIALTTVLALAGAGASEAQTFDPEQNLRRYFELVSAGDLEAVADLFSPDGLLEDPVGLPSARGRMAIIEFLTPLRGLFSEIEFEVPRVFVVTPNEAGVLWIVHAVAAGSSNVIEVHGMAVFTFNDDGKIRSLLEYWEIEDLLSQL